MLKNEMEYFGPLI